MIIIVSLFAAMAICWIVFWILDAKNKDGSGFGAAGFFLGIIVLVVGVGMISDRVSTLGKIQEFKATAETVKIARDNPGISALELAAMQQKVIDSNRWLASKKWYHQNPFFSWFVPKSVMSLKPIR